MRKTLLEGISACKMVFKINVICFCLFIWQASYCDVIFLKNGQNANTEVIDTIGCEVTILRGGNNVSIKKNLIQKLIWKNDTINYDNYVCHEIPGKVMKFQETPEYKLLNLLDGSKQSDLSIRDKTVVAYSKSPLQGYYNPEEFEAFQSALIEIIKKKHTVRMLSQSQMYDEITTDEHTCDYAFFVYKYHLELKPYPRKKLICIELPDVHLNPLKMYPQFEKKKNVYTVCEVLFYDILRKEIVYRSVAVEKSPIGVEVKHSFFDTPTNDKLLEMYEKKETETNLDLNAKYIKNEMSMKIAKYLGVSEYEGKNEPLIKRSWDRHL